MAVNSSYKYSERNEDEHIDTLKNVATANANSEIVQRFGSAAKEHIVALNGVDAESGKVLNRSLDSISKSKVNPNNEATNKKQQAGFSAEVGETAAENAENIIAGKKERKVRADDIGQVNDPLYDHYTVDVDGTIISGSGSQMKFVGNDAADCLQKLSSKKYDKYLNSDTKLEIPNDYYDKVKTLNSEKIASLERQLESAKQKGDSALIEKKQRELEKHRKIDKNLKKSNLSNKDAMFARNNPKLYTTKQVAGIAHRAGVEGAKSGAYVGGTMAIIENAVAMFQGEKDIDEALIDGVIDTGKAATMGYGTSAVGAVVKSEMQNSGARTIKNAGEKAYKDAIAKGANKRAAKKAAEIATEEAINSLSPVSKTLQNLSKTNVPSMIVTVTVETGKVMKRYLSGEIDGTECLIQMGEAGTSIIASSLGAVAYGATLGTVLGGPIGTIVGGLVGAVIGQVMTSLFYKQLVGALQEAKLAREERIRIEAECESAIVAIRQYRDEMTYVMGAYLSDMSDSFDTSLNQIRSALNLNDTDAFILSASSITEKFESNLQFRNMNEFELLMQSDAALVL